MNRGVVYLRQSVCLVFFNPVVVVEKKKQAAAASSTCRSARVVGNCLCGTRGGLNVGQPRAAGPGHEAPPVPAEPRDFPPPRLHLSISRALSLSLSSSLPLFQSARALRRSRSFRPFVFSKRQTRPPFSICLLLPFTQPRARDPFSLLRLHEMTDERAFETERKCQQPMRLFLLLLLFVFSCAWNALITSLINKYSRFW